MRHGQLVTKLRELMRASFELRYEGALHASKVRAQAYADGYMSALLDSGQLDQRSLMRMVADERKQLEERVLKSSSGAGTVQSAFARPPA